MKNRLITGILFTVLGILIATGSLWLFSVCPIPEAPARPMGCHWVEQALRGVGAAVVLIGIMVFLLKDKKIRAGLSLGAALFGLLTILVPTKLIGVCRMASMLCHRTHSGPLWIVFGAALIIISLVNAYFLTKKEKPKYDPSSFEDAQDSV